MNQIALRPKGKKPTLALAVTNDLVTDNRVHKIACTLTNMGYEVTLIGRILHNSPAIAPRKYSTLRFSLWFNNGPLFYANYNLALFFHLIIKRYDVIVANDLDTLLAGFVASEITKTSLVYDSHEYFTEVPELVERPWIKRRWEKIEEGILPKVKHCYTVCQSIANIYNTKYGTNFRVVRNLPFRKHDDEIASNPPFPTDLPVILYQGAVNLGRGLQEAIQAMQYINNARLVIIGDGDEMDDIKQLVAEKQLNNKVIIAGRIPFDELKKVTPLATIGLSIEQDMGLNYRYALPNKLFDYIQSGVPVLASQLPEIKKIVDDYKVGHTIVKTSIEELVKGIQLMLASPELMAKWKENCRIAAEELCWENEEKVLISVYSSIK